MKKSTRLLSAALVTTFIAGILALPAAAAGSNYTAVAAQDTSFTKYLLVDKGQKAPKIDFTYTVASGAAIAPTTSTLQVYPGVGTPDVKTVSFTTTDTPEATSLNANYDTYMKTIEVDFKTSAITFSEPGVYRYIITENNNSGSGVYYDVDPSDPTDSSLYGTRIRTLDVYVEDDLSTDAKDLIVTSYVLYNGTVTTAPPSASTASNGTALTATTPVITPASPTNGQEPSGATKTDRIVNYFTTYKITFGKEVTGNQGSRDKYFKLTLTLTSPVDATLLVDISKADAAAGTNDATTVSGSNPTTISLTANTASATDFYLQDGQYITVAGLPVDTVYALTEDAEGYTSTEGIVQALSTLNWDDDASTGTATDGFDALSDAVNGTITNADIHTGYTNDKQGIIPTGVLVKIAPVIGVGLIIVAGVIFFAVVTTRNREQDDLDTENT